MKRIKSYSIKKRQETNQKYMYGMPDENNKSGQGGDVGAGAGLLLQGWSGKDGSK